MKTNPFPRLLVLAMLFVVTSAAVAQTIGPTSSQPVVTSVDVVLWADVDQGYSACKNKISGMCDDYSYACTYGVSYFTVTDVTATYRGSSEVTGTYINHYDCRGKCVAVCNTAPRTGPTPSTQCDPGEEGNECTSPILVDLGAGGFALTDSGNGVSFDIDGDGIVERVSWTDSSSEDAFLALDRNGDEAITSGAELFGNVTDQPPSAEPNGYRALGVFDDPGSGGNGDGLITADDAIWWSLRLWIDASHDGISQPEELFTLSDYRLEVIDLDYVASRHQDRHGNEFRYKSDVILTGPGQRKTRSADVFLRLE